MSELFQVFSRRAQETVTAPKPLTPAFKNRVLMRLRDDTSLRPRFASLYGEIQSKLAYVHGTSLLSGHHQASVADDVFAFLGTCSDLHFLDFVELVFRTTAAVQCDGTQLVQDINEFLDVDQLPYALTDFVWTPGAVIRAGLPIDAGEDSDAVPSRNPEGF